MGKSLYDTLGKPNIDLISAWKRDGWTEFAIANELGISQRTLAQWKKMHPEFRKACELNRKHVDLVNVVNAFLRRATGYDVTEYTRQYAFDEDGNRRLVSEYEKTRHIPADVTAASAWIRLRLKDDAVWKDFGQTSIAEELENGGGVVFIPNRNTLTPPTVDSDCVDAPEPTVQIEDPTATTPPPTERVPVCGESKGYNPEPPCPTPQDEGGLI